MDEALIKEEDYIIIPSKRYLRRRKYARSQQNRLCRGCNSLCCRLKDMNVVLIKSEQTKYRNVIKKDLKWDKTYVFLKKKSNGECVYLNSKKNKCSIYARRPAACKGWYCGAAPGELHLPFSTVARMAEMAQEQGISFDIKGITPDTVFIEDVRSILLI